MKQSMRELAVLFVDKSIQCAFSLIGFLLILVLAAATVSAEGISGYLDYQFSNLTSETKNVDGQISNLRSTTFNQQYNLTFLRTLYPNLKFYANGIFEKDYVKTTIDGVNTTAKTTITRPVLDLSLKTPFYYAGLNYNRRDERDEATGLSTATATNTREEYNALLGWKPSGLPSLEGRYTRTLTYDKERLFRNTTEDFTQVTSLYEPLKNFFVRYKGSYRDTNDLLQHVEVRQLTNNGRADYSGGFFDNRITVSGTYDYTRSDTDTIASGTGDVIFPISTIAQGLSLNDSSPLLDTLNPNGLLTDNNMSVSAGIDLNIGPNGSLFPAQRNMGLNFGIAVEINTLYVWVDRPVSSTNASLFTWRIYVSSDNLHWTLSSTILSAPFNSFGLNRFELRFPNVTAQYIKVVTDPLALALLSPGILDDIFITELEPFLAKPAASLQKKFTATTGVANFDLRARILDTPFLFYDLSYFEARSTGVQNTLRSTLSNALVAAHTFNPIFSGTARVAREDGKDTRGYVSAYAYNASFRAVPLKTLTHSLTYSGRNEKNPDGRLNRQAVFLSNTADLYKGISMFLGGGYSFSTSESGQDENTTSLNAGSTITPHEKVTLTLNYSSTDSAFSGGNQLDSTVASQRSDITVAVRPLQTLYLVATLSTVHQNGTSDTLQNYSVDWAPFQGGTLQLSFSYSENLRALDNSVDKILRPSLRWNISKRSYLDLAYLDLRSKSNTQDTSTQIFSANLRVSFE